MKTIIEPKNHESMLAQWHGAQAKMWLFHVSHNRTAICLYRKGEQEAIYVIAVACERISGPFCWKQAEVTVITEEPNQWGELRRRIVDGQAGFELVCADVVIVRGPASVPDDPFDSFLGDGSERAQS